MNKLFVADTNTLISAVIMPFSVTAKAIKKAEIIGRITMSDATKSEFENVLFRKKFDKYLSIEERIIIANNLTKEFVYKEITVEITECRDPKDNIFLELAVSANAECIISGDNDLLTLNPFRNIPILNAADFLIRFDGQ
jgi:putative PIN family toxin of toxin-antitoxin system